MKEAAVRLARERQISVKRALVGMTQAISYTELSREWGDFVVAANGVYSKLKQGARGCSQSEPWFGHKLHERRKDELLSYIHQARNSEEHGLAPAIQNGYKIEPPATGVLLLEAVFHPNKDVTFHIQGDPTAIVRLLLTGALQAVTDVLHQVTFQPPTMHQGQPIADPSAFVVAELAAKYLEGLIEEAAKLPQRP